MLKIRLQGTTKDLKWFIKILSKDRRFKVNTPSEPMDIVGTKKYKRVYTEIFRDGEEIRPYKKDNGLEIPNRYYGSGRIFGYAHNENNK